VELPLMIGMWKVMPALAAGCSIVIKPSETTPLTMLRVAELASEAGIPDGVFNVVTRSGAVCGAALTSHPHIAKVSFTGSTATGKRDCAHGGGYADGRYPGAGR
jgi:phenylacetaldehyde dehydrogenase